MTVDSKAHGLIQYRCRNCNAPYPLGADDVISTCPYCGYTFVVDGGEMKDHFLLPNKLDEAGAKEVVQNWLKMAGGKSVGSRFMKDIELQKPTLQWIPTFRVEASCKTYHFGAKQERKGNATVWKKIEKSSQDTVKEWVLARRHAATFGIEEFITSLLGMSTEKFDIKKTDNAPVLNSEISEEDSIPRAKRRKTENDRAQLQKEMDKLLDYRLEMEPKESSYVHAPYWLIRYEHRGGTFRVAISGATGQVILGELPVTKRYRAKKWFVSIFLLVSAALLFQGLPYVTWAILQGGSSDGEIFAIPIIMFVLGLLLWIGSYSVVGGVLKYEIQMTARGEEREKGFSLE
ncbi:MAG: hypothetical protein ACFFAY_07350, partial [Promethearchaeota archaeon]